MARQEQRNTQPYDFPRVCVVSCVRYCCTDICDVYSGVCVWRMVWCGGVWAWVGYWLGMFALCQSKHHFILWYIYIYILGIGFGQGFGRVI